MRIFVRIFVISILVVPVAELRANHISLVGGMNATLARGATQTFNVTIQFNSSGHNGPISVVVNAGPELTLGKTTMPSPFSCTETPSVNTCRATINNGAGTSISITQVITVRNDAARSQGAWTIQLVGDGLSGVDPAVGIITITNPLPKIVVLFAPAGMMQGSDEAGATDGFTIQNVGDGVAANVLATQSSGSDFFRFGTDGVMRFINVQPGEVQSAASSITALSRPAGRYVGGIQLSGDGVGADSSLNVRLLVANRPSTPPNPVPANNRIDSSSAAGDPNPSLSVPVKNDGTGTTRAIVSADVPWIIPPTDLLTIQAGETASVAFNIDLAKQAAVLSEMGGSGSLTGTLKLQYLLPAGGATKGNIGTHSSPGTSSSSVTVVSTVKATVVTSTIPPLPDVHGQLFMAGVGHVVGSVGLFISDLAIFPQVENDNPVMRIRSLSDVDMYYTPLGGGTTRKATLSSLAPPNVAALGDLVGTIYGATQEVGSLQIRTPGFLAASVVGVNANVFNVSGAKGTYGTSIPVFRYNKSQCSTDLTKKVYLTGLRKDATSHTNFYLQETCGAAAKLTLDFLDANGNKIGTTNADVPAFAAIQLGQATLPDGAVSAVISHAAGSAGGFVAYATPVDRASGDTWAQVDWPKLLGYQPSLPVIIPVAGALPGANNTSFRTDVSIMNIGTTSGAGTLRFYNRTGEVIDRTVTLAAQRTATYVDVTTTLFGIGTPHVGYLVFTPTSGTFVVTSRNYSTPAGSNATFGTAVPIVPVFDSLGLTEVRRIGGVEDAAPATIASAQPATFRSNIGLIETKGEAATVKVTVMYRYTSSLVSTINARSATFELAPRQFVLTGLGAAIFGADRPAAGDLHNLLVEFEVIGGTGNVLPFVSSIDNGTGDSTFRVE